MNGYTTCQLHSFCCYLDCVTCTGTGRFKYIIEKYKEVQVYQHKYLQRISYFHLATTWICSLRMCIITCIVRYNLYRNACRPRSNGQFLSCGVWSHIVKSRFRRKWKPSSSDFSEILVPLIHTICLAQSLNVTKVCI